MRKEFLILLAAAALAGCAGPAVPEGEKEAFKSFGWEWRGKDHPASYPVTPTSASTSDPQGLSAEEREFQDWRAWQEWRRKNPK
jgi:hypothetical protein